MDSLFSYILSTTNQQLVLRSP